MKQNPEYGIHLGVPDADYRAWDALNFSAVKIAATKTLAHYHYEKTHPSEPTAAMSLGTATHAAVLEPDRFATDYAKAPKVDKRTKVGKETWAKFELDHQHATVLTESDHDLCSAMSEAAWAHPLAREILKGPGGNEVSALWKDSETGMDSKCRVDRITDFDGWTHLVDVKTAKDASPRGFARAIANFDYHQQAAWYLDGMDEIDARPRHFTFIAIESSPPHCVAVYTLDEWAIDQGRDEIASAKAAVAKASESGIWPGYPSELTELRLPEWRQRSEND